jgi:hypothetical protein
MCVINLTISKQKKNPDQIGASPPKKTSKVYSEQCEEICLGTGAEPKA